MASGGRVITANAAQSIYDTIITIINIYVLSCQNDASAIRHFEQFFFPYNLSLSIVCTYYMRRELLVVIPVRYNKTFARLAAYSYL